MIVRRNKQFSEEKQKNKTKKALQAGGLVTGGVVLNNVTPVLANNRIKKVSKKLNNPKFAGTSEDKVLKEKLSKWARDKREVPIFQEGNLTSSSSAAIPSTIYHSNGKKISHVGIFTGEKAPASALAHELGHAEYMGYKGKGGKVGRFLHKISPRMDELPNSLGANTAHFINGLHSGYVKEKNKDKGKKTNIITKYKSVAAPLLLSVPTLATEAMASKKGMKLLREHGASKKYLKEARKHMGSAYNTYLLKQSIPLASSVGGEITGRGIRKVGNLLRDKNKENTVDDYESKKE